MKNRRNIVELKYPPENPNDIWLKDGKFYRSTSEGWVVIDSKTEYTSKESMITDKPEGGTIGIDKETGETSIYNDVAKQWSPLSGGGVTSITWKELKDKRDAGKLIPGALYRITDYQCTTTQENTQSAGHQFDIVLLALSENKLAEEGWAMMHDNIYDVTFDDGVIKKCYLYKVDDTHYNVVLVDTLLGCECEVNSDIEDINETAKTANVIGYQSTVVDVENLPYNYFQNSNLSAWKVWYCLDNDKSRFAWADEENGKGVIYRLIDEFNNDIKYDFKNIQFKRKITDGQYDATNGTETWCYTLNIWYNGMCQDASIVGNTLLNDEGFVNGVYDNKFGCATAYDLSIDGADTFAFALGDNVVLSLFANEDWYFGILSNTFGNGSHSNTIGNVFYSNMIGNGFSSNIIGNDFNSNMIGNGFYSNTIGNNFFFNTIGNNFNNETISDNTSGKNYGNNGVELATKS